MNRSRITRRRFGRLALATAAAGIAAPRIVRAAATLRIFAWEGYADAPWVDQFFERTGATASITYADSVDAMFERVQDSNGADFDVLAFDTGSLKRYVERRLIQPLEMARLRNRRNLQPAFREVSAVMFAGRTYGAPFTWGSLPLIYDQAAFPDGAPESWAVMWDAQHAQQMIVLDNANNNVLNTAILLGYEDKFNLTDAQLAEIKARLLEQKRLVLTYYAGFDEGVDMFAQGGVKLMFAMGEPQVAMLNARGVKAAMTIPKEGAIGWLDCWGVSVGAQDLDLAHAWIDLMLQKEVGGHVTEQAGYANTTDAAANDKAGFDYAGKLVFLQAPEDFQKRTALWNEVKAAPI